MIKIIFLDIDGCLSDGGIFKTNTGDEFKRFDVKDGFGVEQWNKMGNISAIITGKNSQIVENRAKELGVKYCFQGVGDKLEKAREILKTEGLEFAEAAAIGDDLNDIKLLKNVALSFCPADAHSALNFAFRLSKNGGRGAVREMIEIILEKNSQKSEWIKQWL